MSHQKIFSSIYENKEWGNLESLSGFGSTRSFNEPFYIPFIKDFIINNKIKSIADLGCGDFFIGKLIFEDIKDIEYTGYDCVEFIIENNKRKYLNYNFVYLDILKNMNDIKNSELFIIKDVFHHWSNLEIQTFLENFIKNKTYKYMLITNTFSFVEKNIEIETTGKFRPLSALDYPFNKFNPIVIKNWGNKELHYNWNSKWLPYILQTFLIIK